MNKQKHNHRISQSAINWTTIKNIYLQGAKNIHSPAPYSSPQHYSLNSEQIQRNIALIIEQIVKVYNVFFQQFQQQYHQQMDKLQQRFIQLQQTLQLIQKDNKKANKTHHFSQHHHKPNHTFEKTSTKHENSYPRNKSYIHIEQSQECFGDDNTGQNQQKQQISLLEEQPYEDKANIVDKQFKSSNWKDKGQSLKTKQSTPMSHHNSHFLDHAFQQQILTYRSNGNTTLYQSDPIDHHNNCSQGRLETKTSTIFDFESQTLQRQISTLRKTIESSLHIHIIPYPSITPQHQPKYSYPNFNNNSSLSQHEHLINQNRDLRLQFERYRKQLQESSSQLRDIKNVLVQGQRSNRYS